MSFQATVETYKPKSLRDIKHMLMAALCLDDHFVSNYQNRSTLLCLRAYIRKSDMILPVSNVIELCIATSYLI